MTIIKISLFLLFLAVIIPFAILYRNDANLLQEPGLNQRLKIFLGTNMAKTKDDHLLPELRTPTYELNAQRLFDIILREATGMGWDVLQADPENQSARFTVSSPMFRFKDDVFVQVRFEAMKQSSVYMESRSRTGSADLAANSSHIQQLLKRLRRYR